MYCTYRGCDAADQDFVCSRIDNETGEPAFAFLNLHPRREFFFKKGPQNKGNSYEVAIPTARSVGFPFSEQSA